MKQVSIISVIEAARLHRQGAALRPQLDYFHPTSKPPEIEDLDRFIGILHKVLRSDAGQVAAFVQGQITHDESYLGAYERARVCLGAGADGPLTESQRKILLEKFGPGVLQPGYAEKIKEQNIKRQWFLDHLRRFSSIAAEQSGEKKTNGNIPETAVPVKAG